MMQEASSFLRSLTNEPRNGSISQKSRPNRRDNYDLRTHHSQFSRTSKIVASSRSKKFKRKLEVRVKPFGKPKHYNSTSFHRQCVRYVKSRQAGFIHPRDTSYAGLAKALESFAGSTSIGSFTDRCREAAFKIGFLIRARAPRWVGNNLGQNVKQKQHHCRNDRNKFYQSLEWKKLRYATLKKYGGKCQCCGVSGEDAQLHVDHIKPISKYWNLRLDPDNLQVLCRDCNWGKLNIDQTDWRGKRVLWDDKWPD